MWNMLLNSPKRPCAAGVLPGPASSVASPSSSGGQLPSQIWLRTERGAERTRSPAAAGWLSEQWRPEGCHSEDRPHCWLVPQSPDRFGAGPSSGPVWTEAPGLWKLCGSTPEQPEGSAPGVRAPAEPENVSQAFQGEWLSHCAGLLTSLPLKQENELVLKDSTKTNRKSCGFLKTQIQDCNNIWLSEEVRKVPQCPSL